MERKINWKPNDIESFWRRWFFFSEGSRVISRFALIERINNSTHYQLCFAFQRAEIKKNLWTFKSMEIYAFFFSFSQHPQCRKRKKNVKYQQKRVNFEFFKMLIFDNFFGKTRNKKTSASKYRLMCVKNISPLPCEGRFRFAVANVYRLTGCGIEKKN